MEKTRYALLVLLSSLLIMLTGCGRRDILDDYPDGLVQIKLDWGDLADHLPVGKWMVIYPEDNSLKPFSREISGDEFVDTLPRGYYQALLLAMDKDIKNIEFVQMQQLALGSISLKAPAEGGSYPHPELVYSRLMDVDLQSSRSVRMTIAPKPLVMKAIFEIKLPGVQKVDARLKGIPVSITAKNLAAVFAHPDDYIDLVSEHANGVLTLSGNMLMPLNERNRTRASLEELLIQLEISVVYDSGETEEIKVDVTEAVNAAAAQEPVEVKFELVKIGMTVTVAQWEIGTGSGDVS